MRTKMIGLWVLAFGLACVSPKQDSGTHNDADVTQVDEPDADDSPPVHRDGPATAAKDGPADGPEVDGPAADAPTPIDMGPLCSSGATRCAPSGTAVESCSNGAWTVKETCPYVCANAACSSMCMANVPCTQGLMPCRKGTTSCASPTSQPVCTDSGVDDTAGGCTGGNVCKNGSCVLPCAAGVACTQGIAPCHRGATFCATPGSTPECRDAGPDDSRGGCSGGNVCKNGDCVAPCKANVACTDGIAACRKGKTTCSSPTADPVCKDAGADDTNNSCGSGKICKSGMCCSSKVGQNCVGNNPCMSGTYDCSGVCDAQPVSGTCGTGSGCVNNATKQADYCSNGQCTNFSPVQCGALKVCQNNQCYIPDGGDCTAQKTGCLPTSHCESAGTCSVDPYPYCFSDTPCPVGSVCHMIKNPEEWYCRPGPG